MKQIGKSFLGIACIFSMHQTYGDVKELIRAAYNNETTIVTQERSGILNQDEYKTAQDLGIPGNSYELNALSAAALQGHQDIIKELMNQTLSQKAPNVNAHNSLGQTPLMFAVLGGYADTAKLLVETYKADVNIQDTDGDTALMYVLVKAEHTKQDDQLFEIFKLLLAHGTDVNRQNRTTNQSALFLAVTLPESKSRYLEVLLEKNPDLEIKDNSNKTALQVAIDNQKAHFAALIEKAKPLPTPPPALPVPIHIPIPTPLPAPVIPVSGAEDLLKKNLLTLATSLKTVTSHLSAATIITPTSEPAAAPEAIEQPHETVTKTAKPALQAEKKEKLVGLQKERVKGQQGRKPPSRKKPPTESQS